MALTPDELSGHALGLHSSGMLAMQGVGAALAGAVAQQTSPATAMAVMAAVSLAVTLALAPGLRPGPAGEARRTEQTGRVPSLPPGTVLAGPARHSPSGSRREPVRQSSRERRTAPHTGCLPAPGHGSAHGEGPVRITRAIRTGPSTTDPDAGHCGCRYDRGVCDRRVGGLRSGRAPAPRRALPPAP